MLLLALLTLIVLHLRDTEMKVLVEMGVYKNIDTMNDKELFAEYDKLLVSAKKMRRIIKGKEKKKAKKKLKKSGIAGKIDQMGRSSMGSRDGTGRAGMNVRESVGSDNESAISDGEEREWNTVLI